MLALHSLAAPTIHPCEQLLVGLGVGAVSSSVIVIVVVLGGHAMHGLGCVDTRSLDPEKQIL